MTSPSKVAIVTGASAGIGKHSALALMKEGYAVTFAGRRKDLLEAAAAEGKATGSRSSAINRSLSTSSSSRKDASSLIESIR